MSRARGAELKAAIHERIATVAMEGATATVDDQVRIGVLAWAHDTARVHRVASRGFIASARELYERAADLAVDDPTAVRDAPRSRPAAH